MVIPEPLNTLLPMLVTLAGMVMEVKPDAFWNALDPMLVTLAGMVMEVKPDDWNALVPMLVNKEF